MVILIVNVGEEANQFTNLQRPYKQINHDFDHKTFWIIIFLPAPELVLYNMEQHSSVIHIKSNYITIATEKEVRNVLQALYIFKAVII